MIKIEKNIPVPHRGISGQIPWRDMEVGDSVFIACIDSETKKIRGRVSAVAHAHKSVRFALRKVDGGLRVWRIQAKEA
jgi:hypothetical protein